MSRGSADEDDGEVAGGGGGHRRQQRVDRQDGYCRDGLFASQRRIHVHPAEVLRDGLQLLQTKRGRQESTLERFK